MSLNYYAQDKIIVQLEKAYAEEKYEQIISEFSENVSEYPAKAIYYVGLAYYMKADDNNALKLMNLSIKKNRTDPDAHYFKGMTLNFMGEYDHAIESFEEAIKLDASRTTYFVGLGDAYFSQDKFEKALSAYLTATEKGESIDRPFAMIPQMYAELNQPEKALIAYYIAKETVSKESPSYLNAIYNIGVYEFLKKDYDKSEIAFKELIELAPGDYNSYVKLIQIYYGRKEYKKAIPLKEKLYKGYEQDKLPGNLTNMFCFDQFDWNEKLIYVYERFEEKEGELYYKHIFFITNEKGETEFTIQTENSPMSVELGGPKYMLGMDKDGTHSTFLYGFEEDFDYEDLKKTVILVLEEKVKAGASSRVGKK